MRRRIIWGSAIALGLLALGAVMAVAGWRDLRTARAQLLAARSSLLATAQNPDILRTSGGRGEARHQIDLARGQISAARHVVGRSPALLVSRFLPLAAQQRHGIDQLVDDSETGATAARHLLDEVDRLADQTKLKDGRIPYAGMGEFEVAVRAAGEQVKGLNRSSFWLWGPLGGARDRFDRIASDSSYRLLQAADALRASRSFLGANGDRRYFVALQNNAEMRDQGMVLSYAVARVSGGHLTFERHGGIHDLTLKQAIARPVPAGTSEVFGSLNPTTLWQSVNATADFVWSARAMADMYKQATGESVDGVIAVDIPGLTPLLRAVGPLTVAGIDRPVTADNAAQVLLHDLYEKFPAQDEAVRQGNLANVATAVIDRLGHGSIDLVGVGRELGDKVAGGHLRLWSTSPPEERAFERLGLGGAPATVDPRRTFHLAVENRTATKLDYYVHPIVQEEVRLDQQGTAVVRTTVTVDNRAPVGAKPSYQLGPDDYGTTKKPGDYTGWVLLWGPNGSVQAGNVAESGLALNQYIVSLSAGEKRTVSFESVIPHAVENGKLVVRFVPQPRLDASQLTVTLVAPGWRIGGAARWDGPWDRVRKFTWTAGR